MPNLHFDPLALVTKLDEPGDRGEPVYEVDRDVLYPAMLKAIAAGGEPTPGEDAGRYTGLLKACRARPEAMSDAGRECEHVERDEEQQTIRGGKVVETKQVKVKVPLCVAESLTPERRAERAKVLETCRLWFTNELHQAVGRGPIKLRIIGSPESKPRWKL